MIVPTLKFPMTNGKSTKLGMLKGMKVCMSCPMTIVKSTNLGVLEVAKAYMSCRWTGISTVVPSSRAADSGVVDPSGNRILVITWRSFMTRVETRIAFIP